VARLVAVGVCTIVSVHNSAGDGSGDPWKW
jgi:hypothetical protein